MYIVKNIISDPLTIEDEVELTCQRSKFVLDSSSSNEYEMSVGLSISQRFAWRSQLTEMLVNL